DVKEHYDAAKFTNPTEIDNKYYPLEPGTTFIYKGTKEGQTIRDEVIVTHKTKVIEGVTTCVIRDNLYVNGTLSEKTDDWFAQDDAGNVWYFGEFTTEIDTGSHEGS
ncbi:MAG TPA: hypothetical protein VKL21_00260, partial [Candidatus Methanoperedens sp.]|nr:hypothetical protein [Candidatus Methanoperedens sp.]